MKQERDLEGENLMEEKNSILKTSCMKHYKDEFNDNCYELLVLRWFRDNYISEDDIEKYYKLSPIIIDGINKIESNDMIYDHIYNNVVKSCVNLVENDDYKLAYNKIRNSMISFKEIFARPLLEEKIVKALTKTK